MIFRARRHRRDEKECRRPELCLKVDAARLWLLEKNEGRPGKSVSAFEKKASPSSPGGSRPDSEEKAASGSELSRAGDSQ